MHPNNKSVFLSIVALFGVGHNMGHFEPIYFDQKIKSLITDD